MGNVSVGLSLGLSLIKPCERCIRTLTHQSEAELLRTCQLQVTCRYHMPRTCHLRPKILAAACEAQHNQFYTAR